VSQAHTTRIAKRGARCTSRAALGWMSHALPIREGKPRLHFVFHLPPPTPHPGALGSNLCGKVRGSDQLLSDTLGLTATSSIHKWRGRKVGCWETIPLHNDWWRTRSDGLQGACTSQRSRMPPPRLPLFCSGALICSRSLSLSLALSCSIY
jgi:hypothetical protein